MSSPPTEYLRHMLAEADYIAEYSADLERDEFLGDETLKRAFVRSIEIIGEATKHVPDDFRHRAPRIRMASDGRHARPPDPRLLRRRL